MPPSSSPPPLPPRRSTEVSALSHRTLDNNAAATAKKNKQLVIAGIAAASIAFLLFLLFVAGVGLTVGMNVISRDESAENTTATPSDVAPNPVSDVLPAEVQSPGKDNTSLTTAEPQPKPSDPEPTKTGDENQKSNAPEIGDGSESPKDEKPTAPKGTDPTNATNEPTAGAASSPALNSNAGDKLPGGKEYTVAGGSFFGLAPEGNSVVYVLDCSSSMQGAPFQRATEELLRSVASLKRDQAYYVIFFADTSFPMYFPDVQPRLVSATKKNLKELEEWIAKSYAAGGTQPLDSVLHALKLNPKTIFFLTDGGFDPAVVDNIRTANTKKVVINTFAFGDRSGENLLKLIADENLGTYRFIP